MAILPKHLLEGEDMQESEFFRHPIGTGPYKLDSWDEGQAITLVKNEDYFKGVPFLICKFLCILWSQKCQIQITRLHLHCFGIIICHDLEYDLVNVRCTEL